MEEEHFEALRRWGHGLLDDSRDEVHAAGRAITLLCDEVDRLERALWNEKAARQVGTVASSEADVESDQPLEDTLRARIHRKAHSLYTRRATS